MTLVSEVRSPSAEGGLLGLGGAGMERAGPGWGPACGPSLSVGGGERKERGGQALALLTGPAERGCRLQHVTPPGPQSRDPWSSQEGNATCSGVQGGADGAVEL